jgi:hypothetical protein
MEELSVNRTIDLLEPATRIRAFVGEINELYDRCTAGDLKKGCVP